MKISSALSSSQSKTLQNLKSGVKVPRNTSCTRKRVSAHCAGRSQPVSLCNQHSPRPSASLEPRFSSLSLRPVVFLPLSRHVSQTNSAHPLTANRQWLVGSFPSSPEFPQCSGKNAYMFQSEHSGQCSDRNARVITSAVGRALPAPLRYAAPDRRSYMPWQPSRWDR